MEIALGIALTVLSLFLALIVLVVSLAIIYVVALAVTPNTTRAIMEKIDVNLTRKFGGK